MTNIKPVSELRNYNKVLDEVKRNEPVILTKNGYGKYALIDLSELDYLRTMNKLYQDIQHAESGSSTSLDDFIKELDSK